MARYVFDVETDGFLADLTKLHCLVMYDLDTGNTLSLHDGNHLEEGVEMLMDAEQVIGHNIIKFDLPAIQKVYPWFQIDEAKVFDTMTATRLIWTNLKDKDAANANIRGKMTGSHSLKAWGIRLGEHKGDYEGGFERWSLAMQHYCEQDVVVNVALLKLIEGKNYSPQALELEHQFAHILARQERNGFCFDTKAATKLYAQLAAERETLRQELVDTFGSWEVRLDDLIPKRDNKKLGYKAGVPVKKFKTLTFNPGSRQHIANRLTELHGWKPKKFTPSGQPEINETILGELDYPEAKLLNRFFVLDKRISQLAEGDQAWLKCVTPQGRIHGGVNTNGAVTGRCTHMAPNVAQVPSCEKPYGHECRSLFIPRPGWTLVGADASGLELRCLAHFMGRYDGGAYVKELLEGDIHTANMEAAGLAERSMAKTFIYAFLYGAGPDKIGAIVKGGKKEGLRLKSNFLERVPALKKLQQTVKAKAKNYSSLTGLDGRILHVRSQHSALNTLLQAAGAIIMKQALVFLYRDLSASGYEHGVDYAFCANIHDEWQIECKPELADTVGRHAVNAIRATTGHFNFRCPLDGEYKKGTSWADTH